MFAQLEASGRGDHDDRRTGSADERTGLTRPWVFGDELPLDAPATVANALRRAGLRPSAAGGVTLAVEDFEVIETERRTTAAVALLRGPVVLDGAGRPLGTDEADRTGAARTWSRPGSGRTRCR